MNFYSDFINLSTHISFFKTFLKIKIEVEDSPVELPKKIFIDFKGFNYKPNDE